MDLPAAEPQIPKTYPGIDMFQHENALRLFSAESIIKAELGIEGVLPVLITDHLGKIFAQGENSSRRSAGLARQLSLLMSRSTSTPVQGSSPSFCIVQSLAEDQNVQTVNLSTLFYLLSVLPLSGVTQCKRVIDRDSLSWRVTFLDVLLVFLNWGATLKILGLERMEGVLKNMLDHLAASQVSTVSAPVSKSALFPSTHNVQLVLQAIAQRPPRTEFSQLLVLRLLVYAATDSRKTFRQHTTGFRQAVKAVLNSFPDWNQSKAMEVAEFLELNKRLGQHNAAHICCNFFNQGTDRLSHVGLCASHKVLHDVFGFTLSSECSFSTVVDQLKAPRELLERFKMAQLYVLIQILESLMLRSFINSPAFDKRVSDKLQGWAGAVHDHIKCFHNTLNVNNGMVRERASRLNVLCASKARSHHNASALLESPQNSLFK